MPKMRNTSFKFYVSYLGTIIIPSLTILVLVTCGKDSATNPDPPSPPTPPPVQLVPTSIVITPSASTLTSIGQTVRLTAVVHDQNGQPMPGANVTWSSGNGSVATVNAQGLVTAVGNGSTQITARSGNATASVAVTVAQSATHISVMPESATLMSIGATIQLAATVLDQNDQPVSGAVVTWTSSDESVATVSAQGLVTAVGNGSAMITARTESISITIPITVEDTSQDREVLISLFHATNGPNWTNSTNWLSDKSLGEWHGVTTNHVDLVEILVLHDNQLKGPIPSELGQLENLRSLVLSENRLSGLIPRELGQLDMLERLELNDNLDLSGPLPGEMTKLVNLTRLWIDNTQLFIPQTDQFATWLEGIPDKQGVSNGTVSDTQERDALIALYNSTDGPNWTNSTNWLSDEPLGAWHGVSTDHQGRVVVLNLQGNSLTGSIPIELGNLSNLESLHLNRNQLMGSIPAELGSLNNLEDLNLYSNELTGPIPVELVNLSNLESLFLSENQLTGSIPVELGSLSNLERLGLDSNELTGPIPVGLGSLSNLEYLGLSRNQLTGSIPVELGSLSNLIRLVLPYNGLTGSIPVELGSLSNLVSLDLSRNQLTGSIPVELGSLNNLEVLSLGNNQLSGPIPVELGSLSNLESLSLGNSQLSGPIPVELGSLSNLIRLDLRTNQLTGSIPAELGSLNDLEYLDLRENQLTGLIPEELTRLSNLRALFLKGNELTGCIPNAWQDLDLSEHNDLGQLGLPFCDLPGTSIVGTWILSGTNLDRIVEKINMNLVAGGEEADPFLEFAVELLELVFSEGMTFKFESNGVFTQGYEDQEAQGTWSQSGNTLTTSVVNEEQTFTFLIEGNRLTLSSSSVFEYTLPADSDLAIEEALKDVPDFELYSRRS